MGHKVVYNDLEYVEGLIFVHVESGRTDAALLERRGEALVVHQPAPGRVYQESACKHKQITLITEFCTAAI